MCMSACALVYVCVHVSVGLCAGISAHVCACVCVSVHMYVCGMPNIKFVSLACMTQKVQNVKMVLYLCPCVSVCICIVCVVPNIKLVSLVCM